MDGDWISLFFALWILLGLLEALIRAALWSGHTDGQVGSSAQKETPRP